MANQIQITLRHIERSEALETRIRRLAAKLERVHGGIARCRVVVEAPPRHKQHGGQFVVRLDLKVTGHEIVVNRDHSEDPYVALRDAFEAAGRQLEDHARKRLAEARSPRAAPGVPEPAGAADE